MTLDEKLKNFYDLSIAEAEKEQQKELDDYQAQLDRTFEEHKTVREKQAEDEIRDEKTKVDRELNHQLSMREIEIRQELAQKQEALKADLFARVHEKLAALKGTERYTDFMARKISEAKAFAGDEEMTVYIDPSDEAMKDALEKKTGVPLTLSREAFDGGVRAVIRSRNVLIDNSFKTLEADQFDSWSFEGGVQK